MIGFFAKKAFFDGWDHLFSLVLLNAGSIALLALGLLVPPLLAPSGAWLSLAFACLCALLGAVWFSACVFALRAVADFGQLTLGSVLAALKEGLLPGLQFGGLALGIYAALRVGVPFYLASGGFLGALAAGLLLWVGVVLLLALQWYLPLRARLGGGFAKNLRKSLVLFFDNGLFSLFLFLYDAFGLALSFFLAFLVPGPAGVALALDDALRLRLYKYDWLEANPGARRRDVPWESLLTEDKELVGKRSLKGMLFPWKE